MRRKVLITDKVHKHLISGLEELGFIVDVLPEITFDKVLQILPQYFGIVINSKIKMRSKALSVAKSLKFIVRLGSGLEIVDLELTKKLNIDVFNTPEGNCNAVAEHCLAMLLCLKRNILVSDREVRKHIWHREKNRGVELSNKTIGIIGFGNTGSSFAKILKGFDLKILAYDKYDKTNFKHFTHVESVDLQALLSKSDILSIHLPYNEETHHMFNFELLGNCKDGVIVINTSRGSIVNTQDLLDGLSNMKIKGACLDVFEQEKPEKYTENEEGMYHKLFNLNNVVLTPHIAGWTEESLYKIADTAVRKISRMNYL